MGPASQLPGQPTCQQVALLVARDDPVSKALSGVLSLQGWRVVDAPDNRSALKLVEENAFDLIITGPETSGKEDIELLRRIRRVRPHTRLIILTDENTPSDVITAM